MRTVMGGLLHHPCSPLTAVLNITVYLPSTMYQLYPNQYGSIITDKG